MLSATCGALPDSAAKSKPAPEPVTNEAKVQKSRIGKGPVTAFADRDAIKAFKVLCIQQDITQQDAILEALNDWCRKHGQPGLF